MFSKICKSTKNSLLSAITKLNNSKAEGYIDSGVKIIIATVVGGLLLAFLYWLLGELIIPIQTSQINHLFDFKG